MRHFVLIYRGANGPEEIALELDPPRCVFTGRGARDVAELVALPDGRLSLVFESGRQICGRALPAGPGDVEVVTGGSSRRIALAEPLRDRLAHAADRGGAETGDEEILALMPGRVVEVAVAEGEQVAPGALLMVLEAMKMQNEIRTARGGTVVRLSVDAGQAVDGGARLAVLTRLET